MKFIRNFLTICESVVTALRDIRNSLTDNQKKQNEILEAINSKHRNLEGIIYTDSGSLSWDVSVNFEEDCRDPGVMISKKKAVKIITINGKAEKKETFTREASLTKDEKALYKKYGVVLIVNI